MSVGFSVTLKDGMSSRKKVWTGVVMSPLWDAHGRFPPVLPPNGHEHGTDPTPALASWAGVAKFGDHHALLIEVAIEPGSSLAEALSLQQQGVRLPTRGQWVLAVGEDGYGAAALSGFVPRGDDRPDIRVEVGLALPDWGRALLTGARLDAPVLLINDANEGDLGTREMLENSVEIADTPWAVIEDALAPLHKAGKL